MRVLVTGSSGKIGAVVTAHLRRAGHDPVEFDLARGQDVRDPVALAAAGRGVEAVVHLAAVVEDAGDDRVLMETNLLGTWNVLRAARTAGVGRVVHFSSVNALGIFMGGHAPDYLPIDDDHASHARRPYDLSKRLSEEICRAFTADTGIATICLRPPAVWDEGDYERISRRREADPASEWTPYWEYGAFLDIRDAASALECALVCPDPGHATLLLCAADISATRPAREMARRIWPQVPWRGGPEYDRDPYRALVNADRARATLQWLPRFGWRPKFGALESWTR